MDTNHACKTTTTSVPLVQDQASALHDLNVGRLRTGPEAAAFFKIGTTTLDRLRYDRRLAYYRIGGSVRFGLWDLLELVSGKLVLPESIVPDVDRVLTKAELARFLGVSQRTVEHLMRDHGLWHRKVGRSVRFLLADILTQLANNFRVVSHIQP